MFSVSLKQLNEATNELRSIARQNRSEIENLEDIRSSLRGLSGMDGAISALGGKIDELNSCQQSLMSLCQALESICDMYSKTDRKVSDYCDGNIRKIDYPKIQDIQINTFDSSYNIF
jgi:hypothetical protein